MISLYLAIVAIILLIVYLILFARWNYGKLNNLGFPVIEPTFLKGSVPDIHTKVQHFEDIKRLEKYGTLWGLYQGRTPIVFIADPEIIKQIFVKDTSYFFDREAFDFGNPIVNEILDFLPGEKWKTMRVSQTKLFSSGKMKHYSNNIFKSSMDQFMLEMDKDLAASATNAVKIDARERFCTFTVDAIGKSMLSMAVEPSDENEFYTACKRLIGEGQVISSFYVWTLIFPFLAKFEPTLVLDNAMINTFRELLSARRTVGKKLDDYADIMLELLDKRTTPQYKKLKITETTIMGQAVNLFLAGFDRISTAMTFLAYHLAKNTEIQDKLYEEINSVVNEQDNAEINYETLQNMPYLNACISEALRMYPIFIRPERVCTKDWEDAEKGIKIPKGVLVQIPSWAVNRDSNNYEDPHEFKPERFLPENKINLNPYAFSSFGFGHRNCIGTRFAQEAMRVSICKMMLRYRFQIRDDTRVNFKPGLIMIIQYDPIYLDIVKR